jgi:hypothetical protein
LPHSIGSRVTEIVGTRKFGRVVSVAQYRPDRDARRRTLLRCASFRDPGFLIRLLRLLRRRHGLEDPIKLRRFRIGRIGKAEQQRRNNPDRYLCCHDGPPPQNVPTVADHGPTVNAQARTCAHRLGRPPTVP